MIEIIIGAFIAIFSILITQYLQYFLSLKKEEKRKKTESIQLMKVTLLELTFHLSYLRSFCLTLSSKSGDFKRFKYVEKNIESLKELVKLSSALSTFSTTKKLAKSIDQLNEKVFLFTFLLEEKTVDYTKKIKEKDIDEVSKYYSYLKKEIDELLEMSVD